MKAKLLMFAIWAGMLAFIACTQEKIIYVEKEDINDGSGGMENIELKPGEGIIKISLSSDMSRAVRPITDSDAANNINKILFKFVKSNDELYTDFNIEGAVDITDGDIYEGTGSDIESGTKTNVLTITRVLEGTQTFYVKFSGLRPANETDDEKNKDISYKVFAFGYNSDSDEIPFDLSYNSDTFECEAKDEEANDDNYPMIEELFAGTTNYTNINVNKFGLFTNTDITIVLQRQVAALMAYMKNVPVYVNQRGADTTTPVKVKKITVSTPAKIRGIYAPSSAEYNGYQLKNNMDYGILFENITFDTFDHLLTFNLNNPSSITVDDRGKHYVFEDNESGDETYLTAEENGYGFFDGEFGNKTNGQVFEPMENTLFGSCYLYPYKSSFGLQYFGTLNICYWSENDELIDCVSLQTSNGEDDFHILRNNFYKIGNLYARDDEEEDKPMDIEMPSGSDLNIVVIEDKFDQVNDMINPITD